jgi:hypothetical protein
LNLGWRGTKPVRGKYPDYTDHSGEYGSGITVNTYGTHDCNPATMFPYPNTGHYISGSRQNGHKITSETENGKKIL